METTSTPTPESWIKPLVPPPEVHEDGGGPTEEVDKEGSEQSTSNDADVWPQVVVNEVHRELFVATLKGDWKTAKKIINNDRKAMTTEVMKVRDESITMLEVAVIAAQDQLVENLVKHFPSECDVSIFNKALWRASQSGRMRMVKALVVKVGAESVDSALFIANVHAPTQKDVIWYLAKCTSDLPKYFTMRRLIMAGHLDILLYLARKNVSSATSPLIKDGEMMKRLLRDLVTMKSSFRSGARLNFWEQSIYKCIPRCLVDISIDSSKDTKMGQALERFKISLPNLAKKSALLIRRIGELKLRHECSLKFAKLAFTEMKTGEEALKILELISGIVLDAASLGIFEIVKLCLEHFPELTWDEKLKNELIKKVVNGRHVELFRLVYTHNTDPYLEDNRFTKHSLMEAVVGWSPGCVLADVSGAAFLMQRELQWFKVLEDRSDPSFRSQKFKVSEDPSFESLTLRRTNERGGKTYWEHFVEHHQGMLKEARQWMKDTSSSCSLVATLIITVAFAAAFTVPGGNDVNTGMPIFLKKGSFMVFAVADALALFSSVTATLMFLAILTSRYAIKDFLLSLPRKMILGLTFLFLSLAFMLVAFSSALTIVLSDQLKWIYIPITLLAAFPVVLFAILQLPLYVEMVESTCWPRLYSPTKIWK